MNSRAGYGLACLLAVLTFLILTVSPALSQTAPKAAETVTLRDVTARLHLQIAPAVDSDSSSSGLDALASARKSWIAAMGGSVAAGDADHDGVIDLYVVVPGASNHLFRGLKDGTFEDVTAKAKVAGSGGDVSAVLADYDHSGHSSLFVAGLGGVRVYHNNGDGTFTDATAKAGLGGKAGELASSVLLFDADGDGWVDALVTVYADLSAASPQAAFPRDFSGASSRLYRNQHDGTFRDVTETSGLVDNPGRTRRAVAADFNQNGRMALLLLRDNKPPALYRNLGNCRFEEETWEAGAENWKFAYLDGQAADFDGDGKMDLALWSTIGNEVLINQGGGKFEPEVHLPLVYAPNRTFGFHGAVADVMGAGAMDLLTVDSSNRWHVMANHKRQFAQVPVIMDGGGKDAPAELTAKLASLLPVRLRKGGPLLLIGVEMDGRVVALEATASRKQAPVGHAEKGK